MQTLTLRVSKNSLGLLSWVSNHKVTNTLVNTYYALKKSVYQKVCKIFEQDIRQFSPNRFRRNNDINMASFLVPWFMYYGGKANERLDICYYFNIRSCKALTCYDRLIKLKQLDASPHSFCANDFNTELKNQVPDYQERLLCMLEKYYS